MNKNETDILRYLNGVYGQLEGLREAKRVYEPQLATKFNPFQLLNLYENDLSRFFADLLSPRGSHGQGPLFLKSFIEHFKFNKPWIHGEHALVETEAPTIQGRRIDIKLTFPDGVLGIENKPWAADQKEQVADYLKELARTGDNHLLIYLSGGGQGPSDYSLGEVKREHPRLEVVSYLKFNEWLKDCAKGAQSLRVRFFIEEFSNYINRQFGEVQDMGENEMIVSEALKSSAALEAVLAVSAAVDTVKNRLLVKLLSEFNYLVETHRPEWIVDIDLKSSSDTKWKGISILFNRGDAYRMRLAFETNGFHECAIGVCKTSKESPDRPHLFQLNTYIAGPAKKSPYWPWYQDFNPMNWDSNPEAWTKIQSGEMASMIFEMMNKIYKGLIDSNFLDELR